VRRLLIAGNWKMNKTVRESLAFVERFSELLKGEELGDREILVCPPFTSLYALSTRELPFSLGAQNMFYEESGAYTGEISPLMLKELGVKYVILGHSERRSIFKEDDELVNKKVLSAAEHGLIPILCVGESLKEREEDRTAEVIERQVVLGLRGLKEESPFVVAYEPVWAIGTGKSATPEMAQEVHRFIREIIEELFSEEKAASTQIIYGGSVKPSNAESLLKMEDIDGALVGGASLEPESFFQIATSCRG